jgi:hypothetical protein
MLASWFTNLLGNKSTHIIVGLQTKVLGAVKKLKFTPMPMYPPTRPIYEKIQKHLRCRAT